jgi:ubiquitin
VFDLFSHLQRQLSYNIAHFSLYENGEELRKDLPVSAIGKAELDLLRPLKKGEMRIFIRTLTGRNIPINVSLNMTVDKLNQLVYDVDGIPPEQQRFIFAGRQFEDGKLLSYYQVSNGSIVHLVLRLRGGMFHLSSTGEGVSSLPGDDVSSLPMFYPKSALAVNHGNRTVFLRVDTFFSLEQVKVLLQEELDIQMEKMTLHNDAGLELENDRALGFYGIELGSTLRLSIA